MLAVRCITRQLIPRIANSRHLIRVRRPSRVESHPKSDIFPFRRVFSHSQHSPMSLDVLTQSLAALSIKTAAAISHADTTSPASWRETLTANGSAPKSFELIKVLVFKPKTAKTATPIPVVVIARDETETNSGALGKKLNLKELRLASEDLLTEFFSLDKNSCLFL